MGARSFPYRSSRPLMGFKPVEESAAGGVLGYHREYTYSDSLRDAGRLTERAVLVVLNEHSLGAEFLEFDREPGAYDKRTGTYSANVLADWLGY